MVARGVKKVVNVDGILVTPDHRILVKDSWKTAKQLDSNKNMLRLALETGSENSPLTELNIGESGLVITLWQKSSVLAGAKNILYKHITYVKERVQDVMLAQKRKLDIGGKIFINMQELCLMTTIGEGYSTEYQQYSTGVATRTIPDIRITEREEL